MSAFNDRRIGKDRREGDRRWLGMLIAFANSLKQDEQGNVAHDEHREGDRRIHGDRRNKKNLLSRIAY